jgi:hypothetical protein
MRSILVQWLLALVTITLCVCIGARPAYADSTISVAPDVFVSISDVSGAVHVVGSSRREVKVSASDGVSVTTSDNGTRVSISVHASQNDAFDVTVPATAHVEVHALSGDVSVRDVTGPVQAASVNGNVVVSGGSLDVEARSVSGNLDLALAHGDVRASTVSGGLTVQLSAGGTVLAKSVSGPVHVTAAPLTRLEVQSLSGDLTLDVRLEGSGPFSARTHSGAVRVSLPKTATTTIAARSFGGAVDIPDAGAPPADAGHTVLSLSCFSGSISVRRK